ncbi:Peptidase M15 [Hartmannibacter diazotrophicus]|uniref:Murein endopeptidase K n=1 Tax=Hartmannibacter diazotrophicus TaxID=1482074 RepID=A0A2C9DAG2_9HYPH|nr:DUF882 domain-containing protein [Hartmannibacter diazotrophicus]SON57223.1 Peptidase M15 [Hartmannibacter diazotrophicus]
MKQYFSICRSVLGWAGKQAGNASAAHGETLRSSRGHQALSRKCLSLSVAAVLLLGLAGLAPARAADDNKVLSLYNTHTHESLRITFKRNGRYIPAALQELNRFLRDWRRNESRKMDPRLFDTVWEVYHLSGSTQPIHVVSGYRSLATNDALRSRSKAVAKHSQHTLGKAMDFYLPDVGVAKLRTIALRMQRGGIGYYPTSNHPFVHVDVGSVRHWPRMTRAQLATVFPDGKTVHIPSDGKPMQGYELALAELKRNAPSSAPLANQAQKKKSRGLLAFLFDSGEDDAEEISAASGESESDAAPAAKAPPGRDLRSAPTQQKIAPPAPVIAGPAPTPPAAPVLTAAETPRTGPVFVNTPQMAQASIPTPEAAPETPAPTVLAFAGGKPPQPRGKPPELLALMARAEEAPASPSAEQTVVAALDVTPRQRPELAPEAPATPELVVADASADTTPDREQVVLTMPSTPDPRAEARQAFAAVTGGKAPDGDISALGYADDSSTLTAAESNVLDSLSQHPGAIVPPSMSATAGLVLPAGAAQKPNARLDSDPLTRLTRVATVDEASIYDQHAMASLGDERNFVHPNQRDMAAFLKKPALVFGAGFTGQPYGDLKMGTFGGEAVTRIPVQHFAGAEARVKLASR